MSCCRRPTAFMHYNGLRLLPCLAQPIEILMMMKRIAPGPIYQLDVGINFASAIELIGRAGLQQHIGYARHRNGFRRRVGWKRKFWTRKLGARYADAIHRALPKSKAASWFANASDHGRKRNRGPIGLLAAMRALQRPRTGKEAIGAGGAAG